MDRKSSVESSSIGVQIAPVFTGAAYASPPAEDRLREVAEAALRHEDRWGQITLVITDDQGIRELNRDFLGRDAPTDVLAFAAQEETEPFVVAPEGGNYLGDVIISYPRAAAQASDLGHPVEQELNLLVVHGVLHLLGYDHATEEEKAVMWARQEEILAHL